MAKKNAYTVPYHLILAIYHEPHIHPSAHELGELWNTLDALGSHAVKGGIRLSGEVEPKTFRGRLGDNAVGSQIRQAGERLDFLAVSSSRPDAYNAIHDSDANLSFASGPNVWEGEQTLADFGLSLSAQVVEQAGTKAVLSILRYCTGLFDLYGAPYGLVDLARPEDAVAGMIYETAWPCHTPLHRWSEQHGWMLSGAKKRDRARGIYWGNYFGGQILNRLGGRDAFVEWYRAVAVDADGSPNAILWEYSNGVFVSLSLDPLDCAPRLTGPSAAADANLLRLCEKLGKQGVLNLW